jgi:hypothetical protein
MSNKMVVEINLEEMVFYLEVRLMQLQDLARDQQKGHLHSVKDLDYFVNNQRAKTTVLFKNEMQH